MKAGNLNFLEPSGPLETSNGNAFMVYILIVLLLQDTMMMVNAVVEIITIYDWTYLCMCIFDLSFK